MTTTIFGGWLALSGGKLERVIDSGRVPEGVPVKLSKRVSWLPAWMSRAFTSFDKRTVITQWPAPGGTLGSYVQAVAFERDSGYDYIAGLVATGNELTRLQS